MQTAQLQLGLECRVLVLNKHYMALRVICAKRAFSLLCREQAEVVACDDGTFANYDFHMWRQVSEAKHTFEAHKYDWVSTVHFAIAVPRVIRLLFYDRLPRQSVKFNRRNIFARDGNRCQYCGKKISHPRIVPGSRRAANTRRQKHLDQYRLRLHRLQRAKRRPYPRTGPHETYPKT